MVGKLGLTETAVSAFGCWRNVVVPAARDRHCSGTWERLRGWRFITDYANARTEARITLRHGQQSAAIRTGWGASREPLMGCCDGRHGIDRCEAAPRPRPPRVAPELCRPRTLPPPWRPYSVPPWVHPRNPL